MVPKYNEIQQPILKFLSEHTDKPYRAKDMLLPLAEHFHLTEEELKAEYASHSKGIFYDRIGWALSYLFIAKLVDKPRKANFTISSEGVKKLKKCTAAEIEKYVQQKVKEQAPAPKKKAKAEIVTPKEEPSETQTPQDRLYDSFLKIKKERLDEILQIALNKDPYDFERMVVQLLQSLGYGGEVKNSGTVTKKSNDGGIDGFIKEDILGFNLIAIQAKRYAQDLHVSREEVQRFVGAVAVTPSKKGVFITTSDFTKGTREYVESLNGNPTIILINGEELAEYVYDSDLGMQTEEVLTIKKIDRDFWDLD